jgi:hypothetical protein
MATLKSKLGTRGWAATPAWPPPRSINRLLIIVHMRELCPWTVSSSRVPLELSRRAAVMALLYLAWLRVSGCRRVATALFLSFFKP